MSVLSFETLTLLWRPMFHLIEWSGTAEAVYGVSVGVWLAVRELLL